VSFLWGNNFRTSLFVISFLLICFSFFINNFRSTTTSPQKFQIVLSESIHQQENDFISFLKTDDVWNKIAFNHFNNDFNCPNTEKFVKNTIMLPCHHYVTEEELDRIYSVLS